MSRDNILEVAFTMAQRDGFGTLTRDGVAAEAGVAMGSINHHWKVMSALRDAVMQRAVEEENLEIIAQGIALGDKIANSAPREIRVKAVNEYLL